MLKKDNIVPVNKVEEEFAANQVVEKAEKDKTASQLQVLEFQNECVTFLHSLTEKMLERCPLKYPIVRATIGLNPLFITHERHRKQLKSLNLS